MTVEFRPVTLDHGDYDNEAVLVFRSGRLMAVLTCLSEIHGDLQGHWFVETTFTGVREPFRTFKDLSHAEAWAAAGSDLV